MKKIFIAIGITLCFNANSQKMETFHNTIAHWNKTYKTWDFDEGRDAEITFELSGDYLIANDEAHSKYFLYDFKDSDIENFFEVDAIDERGIYCTIMISNNTNGVDKIAIIYGGNNSVLYEYWFFF
jgi:hypothetical protein